jgi:transcriptional regulator NrdR family protein
MRCPRCQGDSRVYDTQEAGPLRLRRRVCERCGHRFLTSEEYLRDVAARKKPTLPARGVQTDLFGLPEG